MHYDDVWEEEHSEQFKREKEASQNRKQLFETLNEEEMIRIMFKDFLHKLSDIHMGLTCKPLGKMRSVTRKLENHLAEEAKLQKEKKEKKADKR